MDHCIEWARDKFEGLFVQNVQEAAKFCADPAAWLAELSKEAS